MTNTNRKWWEFTSSSLHILAMFLMLCDHTWSTLLPTKTLLTCIGRIAFPIFAFLTVEGYYHTKNFKRYITRMLIFAFISEVPFNLMYYGTLFYPFQQNVIWTFILALLSLKIMDLLKKKLKTWKLITLDMFIIIITAILSTTLCLEYHTPGILMIFTFYFFRGTKWWNYLGQLIIMYYINTELLGGLCYNFQLFGHNFELVQQSIALIALIPIWLYQGKKGITSKTFQYFCYAFYPTHMLILVIIGHLLTKS